MTSKQLKEIDRLWRGNFIDFADSKITTMRMKEIKVPMVFEILQEDKILGEPLVRAVAEFVKVQSGNVFECYKTLHDYFLL